MAINLQKAEFILSAVAPKFFLRDGLPQVAFSGRSNVGKSSVINRLLNRKNFARVGAAPGKTTQINYFKIDNAFYLVDLPGYGYAKVSKAERDRWGKLMESYFADPELMTLQAVRLIRQCPVLAAPQTASGQMLALDIARSALGEALDGKTIVPLYFAMSRDPAALAVSHEKAAAAVRQYLDAGQDVAMLNIGDVSIYATFGYLQEILQAGGYATAMAAGVPSFCAAAARLNVPLTGGMDTPLTIAPGGWTDRVLEMPGTKVLMKAGRQLPVLLDTLQQADKLKKSALVCNCGLPDERVYPDLSLERPQEQAGYFATVLVKE